MLLPLGAQQNEVGLRSPNADTNVLLVVDLVVLYNLSNRLSCRL